MNTTPDPHGPVDPDSDEYEYEYEDDGFAATLPVRAKRPFLTKWSAGLMALMLAAVGFFVGVRVEKAKIPATSSGAGAFASALAGARGTARTGAASSFASRFAGAAGGAGGFGAAAGNDTVGSVASVNGKTLYITETSGNTVKVKLSGQTTITKTESVKRGKVFPGDEVVIAGTKGSGGTVEATTLTDSGAKATGSTTAGTTSSSSTSGTRASAIRSLFGS